LQSDRDETDLRDVLNLLRRRAPFILGAAVIVVVLTFVVSSRQTKMYAAISHVHITNPNAESVFSQANVQVDPKREVETQTQLLESPEVKAEVDLQLGDRAALVQSVEATGQVTADLIDIKVVSSDPELAHEAANLYATLFVARRGRQVSEVYEKRAAELRAKVSDLDNQLELINTQLASPTPPARGEATKAAIIKEQEDLKTRATQLEIEGATRTGNVEVASLASLPEAPVSPNARKDAAFAGLLALVLGLAIVFLMDRLNDHIETPDEAQRVAGIPLLGTVPIFAPVKKRGPSHLPHGERALVPLSSVHAEAYRTLRTSLRFSTIGQTSPVILVTSASGSEGKSTVTANLAVALAENNLNVVVINADLRRPTLGRIFGIDESKKGLSTTLVGDSEATECFQPVRLPSGHTMFVLPAGPLPPNPSEILGLPAMEDLLTQIRNAGADFILIDSPPVLAVSDALALMPFVDGVITIAVQGQTRAHSLAEAAARLRRVNANLIGLVLNGVPLSGGRYGYSYYSYRRNSYEATADYLSDGDGKVGRDKPSREGRPSGSGKSSSRESKGAASART